MNGSRHAAAPAAQEDELRPESPAATITRHPISIIAEDGYPLAADLISPADGCRGSLVAMVNAGAGLRRRFYRPFAEYLAAAGIPTVIYDYRGVGESRPKSLRGFRATVEDWGSKDCASVLYWLADHFAGARRAVVGHSVGSLVTGFVTNGRLIDELVFVGGHTGYWRDYCWRLRAVMYVTWHVLMPTVTRATGYFPGRALRLGDDLPAGVALDWARRTRAEIWHGARTKSGEVDVTRIADLQQRFAAIRAPILSVRFSDDAFSTAAASRRLCDLFVNSTADATCVSPRELGLSRGGHFRLFKTEVGLPVWSDIVNWMKSHAG